MSAQKSHEPLLQRLGELIVLLRRIAVLRTYMRSVVIDVVVYSVGRSICQSVTIVSPAKTAEPVEMPFRLWTWVSPRKHVLDGDPAPSQNVGGAPCPIFGPCLLWPNGWMDQSETWQAGRPRP